MSDEAKTSETAKNILTRARGAVPAGGGSALSGLTGRSLGLLGLVAAAGYVAYNSFFVVHPAERAMVRVLGKVASEKPLGPGLHFRVAPHFGRRPRPGQPDQPSYPRFQRQYDRQPEDRPRYQRVLLVPEFGGLITCSTKSDKAATSDIRENVVPVVQDRISRIFSVKNTNGISEQREGIQAETTLAVTKALKELFKIDLQSLQIAKIIYGQAFIQSNERSVLAKNEAIAEENRVKVAEFQAKQKVTTAEGEAQQARARASGDADALRLRAKAEKEAAELQGLGAQARYRSEIDGAGGFTNYVALINAQARLKWNGTAPRFMMGGEKGGANFLLPLPESEFRDPVSAPATPAQQPLQQAATPAPAAPVAPAVQPSRR